MDLQKMRLIYKIDFDGANMDEEVMRWVMMRFPETWRGSPVGNKTFQWYSTAIGFQNDFRTFLFGQSITYSRTFSDGTQTLTASKSDTQWRGGWGFNPQLSLRRGRLRGGGREGTRIVLPWGIEQGMKEGNSFVPCSVIMDCLGHDQGFTIPRRNSVYIKLLINMTTKSLVDTRLFIYM